MPLPRSAPPKKLLIIGAVMLLSYGAFAIIIEQTKTEVETGEVLNPLNRADISADEMKINFSGSLITFPAPEGYCFLQKSQETDATALDIVSKAQGHYGNHLWGVFANCIDLDNMRRTKNLNAYRDTGLIITPLQFMNSPVKAEAFSQEAAKQIGAYNVEEVEKVVNEVKKEGVDTSMYVRSNKPDIYYNQDGAMMFTLTHTTPTKQDPIVTTEFEIMTAIKNRAFVVIFKAGELRDTTPHKEKTVAYLKQLRAANPEH